MKFLNEERQNSLLNTMLSSEINSCCNGHFSMANGSDFGGVLFNTTF